MYTPDIQLPCDEILGVLADINVWLRPLWYGHILGRNPATGEKLVKMSQEQIDEVQEASKTKMLPMTLKMLEERLGSKQYFCGNRITIADVQWYVIGSGILDGTYDGGYLGPDILKPFANLLRLLMDVDKHERVLEWNQKKKGFRE